MTENTRPIGWVRAARKAFAGFPPVVRDRINTALTIAAEGSKADIVKPLKGIGPGVMQVAVRYRTDAYRAVYTTEFKEELWVLHAFKKKSKKRARTPGTEIELLRARLAHLRMEFRK
ncbi:MAG: type II toxin-antitoxin system RelE/ParE family toxin [Rhodobacteraceae bacterium]|nr:type II toxin-antitoxin system RelE/ParE family toxin [Paracoccaceae bacterium]